MTFREKRLIREVRKKLINDLPKEELEKLLAEEKKKGELVKEITRELKALKPGGCLVYEAKAGMESALSLILTLSNIKGLELTTRPGKVYAYKE